MVLFRCQRDSDTRKMVLAAKAYRGGVFDAVSLGRFWTTTHTEKKTQTSQSEQGDRENGHPKHKRYNRHKGRDGGEKKGNDYYFPQHVEQDKDEGIGLLEFDDVDGEEDVLNLDDDEE
ncbi:unnamed protein product [Peronospora destructor]|uniref:Uncharacterized protein n=1 Tax=Peronospora destructor TaxID=86335 RepID=A0AAV0VCH5_9STRA|nr:unnamed protein product [Peronospora destructor]